MDLIDLQNICTLDIPIPAKPPDTFFDIIQQGNKENSISRAYAYFLNKNNNKKIADCFLKSLLDIVKTKSGKNLLFPDSNCRLEVKTSKGNRIDIFIESYITKEAIIIENKIYHHLNNDLLDYWDHCTSDCSKKIGILLTLHTHPIPTIVESKYINVTHNEWIDSVIANDIFSDLPFKEIFYLNDFFINMKNLIAMNELNEQANFYFQHANLINEAIETKKMASRYINKQLETVASKLGDGWSLSDGNDDYQQIWNHNQVYYTIITKHLFTEHKSIGVIIELFNTAKENYIVTDLKETLSTDAQYNRLKKDGEVKKTMSISSMNIMK